MNISVPLKAGIFLAIQATISLSGKALFYGVSSCSSELFEVDASGVHSFRRNHLSSLNHEVSLLLHESCVKYVHLLAAIFELRSEMRLEALVETCKHACKISLHIPWRNLCLQERFHLNF